MKYFIIVLTTLLNTTILMAQNTYILRGVVSEQESGEVLQGVVVSVKDRENVSVTNKTGDYTLNLKKGKYTLLYTYFGYKTLEKQVDLTSNQEMNVSLIASDITLDQVVVSAIRRDQNVKGVQSGVDRLEVEKINKIPVLLGERDVLKTLQLLPGIQSAGEGNTGFYVRGGSDDQNLILLDDAVIYSPSHLLGFFSTFNSDVVEDISIYKGSMPANYGGRLSSTLDVGMRDGSKEKYKLAGGVGLISSRLALEGPIVKDKASFIVAARRTYADLLAKGMGMSQIKGSTLYFYDLNAKATYQISKKDKLSLTMYHGRDKLGMKDLMSTDWGNTVASLKWNHIFSSSVVSTTSISYTNYSYNVGIDLTTDLDVASSIRNYNLTQMFAFQLNNENFIKTGFTSIYHQIRPGEVTARDPEKLNVTPYDHRYGWENAVFISHNMKFWDDFEVDYGLRANAYSVLGGGNYYIFDLDKTVTETIKTKRGDFVKTYFNLEPRLSLAYQLDRTSSVKAAYTRTVQNIHLLSTSPMTSTYDRWTGNTNNIKPELADQISLGYFRNFSNDMFEFSVEAYYKDLKNQIDYKDAANILGDDNFETEILFGKGRAYGVEFYLKKKYGRFNGWIGYTISKSQKKIDGINNDKWYDAIQDRTHDLSVVGIFEVNKRWSLSGTWVYASGNPLTFPSAKYTIDGQVIKYYEGRNNYRGEAYHRLDLGATYVMVDNGKRYSELSFGFYNAYGRQNAYMYDFVQSTSDPSVSVVNKIYLFSVIPSISWNFKY